MRAHLPLSVLLLCVPCAGQTVADRDDVDFEGGDHHPSTSFPWPGRAVRFEDVTVDAWNFYVSGYAEVTVRDSLFGELLGFEHGFARVVDSTCDGAGGYLGTRDSSRIELERSDALCTITCDGASSLRMRDGTVAGRVTAAGDATISFHGCTLLGPLVELENGHILVW